MKGKTFVSLCIQNLKTNTRRLSARPCILDKKAETNDLKTSNLKSFSEIPGPAGLPFLGTLLYYKTGRHSVDRFQDALFERYEQFGKICKETIGTETVVHLFDPDYIQEMYRQEGKYPSIPPLIEASKNYREFKQISPGLGNVNGSDWHRLRSAVQKLMLRPKEVTEYLPMMEAIADDFMAKLCRKLTRDGKIEDFYNEVAKWNLESSGMICFESRIGGLDEQTDSESQMIIDANSDIFSLGTKLKFSYPWQRNGSKTWQKHMDAEERFFGKGQEYVDNTVRNIDTLLSSGQLSDNQYKLMAYLLSKKELNFSDISILTLSFFGDGLTSIVPSMINNLYNLATNPETQKILFEEINSSLPKEGGRMTPQTLTKLKYLRACIKETFRLFPVQVDIARITTQDTIIDGYVIPSGTRVELHNFVNLRNPDIFPEPDKFKPERWLKGGSAENVHSFIVLPFSHGPRMCIGRRFAEQDMQILLSKLLQKFEVEWNGGEMGQRYRILMTPDCPIDFTFKFRE